MNADDKIEQLIREIASKHGIAVARDDPILVLQTINHRLLQDSVAAQQAMLDQYKQELEGIGNRWGMDAREKAERVLNAALESSTELMTLLAQASAKAASAAIEDKMKVLMLWADAAAARAYRAAFLNLGAACLTVCAVVLVLLLR
ncbi:conjugal transfer protein TraM [Duganella phyllosphaerae]|uniref:Transcriptional activator TraM n=1 Tax=Duganella phyllosphaerae TaxID=762836 RepID=A0A1E7WG49_9BURK|nr:conjugal transfer protein TraM [Duganella phyllosphaerae]OEZ97403.1 transcriptional activator TraM [Duganella phyllosphaerae]